MTMLQFQKALVSSIRLPKSRYPKNDLSKLTKLEKEQIEELSDTHCFNEYGEELADGRWNRLIKNITRLSKYIKHDIIRDIWLKYEPTAIRVKSDLDGNAAYTIAFLQFASNKLNAPPFIHDLIKYEVVEEELARENQDWPNAHRQSCLKMTNFKILHLGYDIPQLLESSDIDKRPIILLLIGQGRKQGCRVFEIDEQVASYLSSQLNGLSTELDANLYEQLIGIGLVTSTKS